MNWNPPRLPTPSNPYSQAVLAEGGKFLFISGQTPCNACGETVGVGGFRTQSEGSWRWTHDRPVLQFYVPMRALLERSAPPEAGTIRYVPLQAFPRLRFLMDLTFPDQTFAQTGPVELTIRLNGKQFDRVRYAKAGSQQYAKEVPWEWLRPDAGNTVALEPDKFAAGPEKERLGFVLSRAGFVE